MISFGCTDLVTATTPVPSPCATPRGAHESGGKGRRWEWGKWIGRETSFFIAPPFPQGQVKGLGKGQGAGIVLMFVFFSYY